MANSPLQQAPRGLLGFFRLQTLGKNPSAFSDTVVPVAQADAWYGADKLAVESATLVTMAGVANIEIPVPATEVWRVRAVAMLVQTSSIDVNPRGYSAWVTFRPPGSANGPALVFRDGSIAPGIITAQAALTLPQPFVAPAGSIFVGVAQWDSSSNDTALLRVLIERAPA